MIGLRIIPYSQLRMISYFALRAPEIIQGCITLEPRVCTDQKLFREDGNSR